jgi:hypothetical protein
MHKAHGVTIVEDVQADGIRQWRLNAWGEGKENGLVLQEYDDAYIHWRVILRDGETVDQAIAEATNTVTSWSKGNTIISDATKQVFKFVMNTVLYLTSADAEMRMIRISPQLQEYKKPKGKKKTKNKGTLPTSYQRTELGSTFVFARTSKTGSDTSEEGSKHTHRYIVEGHWRRQPYGEGNKLRRLQFIEPHWRGPEHAPLTMRKDIQVR